MPGNAARPRCVHRVRHRRSGRDAVRTGRGLRGPGAAADGGLRPERRPAPGRQHGSRPQPGPDAGGDDQAQRAREHRGHHRPQGAPHGGAHPQPAQHGGGDGVAARICPRRPQRLRPAGGRKPGGGRGLRPVEARRPVRRGRRRGAGSHHRLHHAGRYRPAHRGGGSGQEADGVRGAQAHPRAAGSQAVPAAVGGAGDQGAEGQDRLRPGAAQPRRAAARSRAETLTPEAGATAPAARRRCLSRR
ncbi:conserved hypothetical protein [Xanthobacter versatilis]|uniref:Uncharacterized protein n=1 Tax=Xanthobacter autotrophicus (strain ATCC BAA-1158 / Py2) TaxID=78245 RepID=A7IBR1_XANP2|nr:conserved hypothetical protein [Xanthobacter autotrophicus Py2]